MTYFRDSVGAELEVAGLRRAADLEGPGGDAIVAKLAAAPFVFAGPGSPTYALRQWEGTLVPGLLAEKLAARRGAHLRLGRGPHARGA